MLSRAQGETTTTHSKYQDCSDRGGTHPFGAVRDTSMTPLGFPGRDLPQEWGLNVSHFMTVKHKDFQAEDSGAWMFNAMLPTTDEEIKEFEEKVKFAEDVVASQG